MTVDPHHTPIYDRFIGVNGTALESHAPDPPGPGGWTPTGPLTAWLDQQQDGGRAHGTACAQKPMM